MSQIWGNLGALTWQMVAMWIIGGVMIYLAICKEMEPTLLLPMGFGCILCNLPNSGAVEVLETLFQAGVANELFPLLLFGLDASYLPSRIISPATVSDSS